RLIEENRRRGPADPEFELLDTGAFDKGVSPAFCRISGVLTVQKFSLASETTAPPPPPVVNFDNFGMNKRHARLPHRH
ncbi:MAG: hypothetical protein KGR46_08700, partial [Verrucomicrobia bacterium]|nr:hypothetical protein [Verrucomicrobiota bacterium]